MPFKIQRVPRGLNDLLSIFGGATPTELEDRIAGNIDLLQFYGQTQLQTAFQNAPAAVVGGGAGTPLSPDHWCVLFGCHGSVAKTAAMTAFSGTIAVNRRTQFSPLVHTCLTLQPYGATEVGTVSFGGMLPYPLLCPPGTQVDFFVRILAGVANVNVSIFAEFGVF